MRKIMMAAVGLVMSGGVAWGQAATQDVQLSAFVGTYCTIGGVATGSARTATVSVANGRAVGGPVTINGTQGSVTCTGAASLTLASQSIGLTHNDGTSPPVGFTKKIHYTATAQVAGQPATPVSIDTSATATASGAGTIPSEVTGAVLSIGVIVTPTATNSLLVNGNYSDILRVTITPQ